MVLERLKEYIDSKGISIASLEKAVGMSNSSFRKALQSGGGIGTDKLEKILSTYPDLSAEWLLRGTGNMQRGEDQATDRKLVELCRRLVGLFEQKDEAIHELSAAIKSIENG